MFIPMCLHMQSTPSGSSAGQLHQAMRSGPQKHPANDQKDSFGRLLPTTGNQVSKEQQLADAGNPPIPGVRHAGFLADHRHSLVAKKRAAAGGLQLRAEACRQQERRLAPQLTQGGLLLPVRYLILLARPESAWRPCMAAGSSRCLLEFSGDFGECMVVACSPLMQGLMPGLLRRPDR
jgi:hypothetical protein